MMEIDVKLRLSAEEALEDPWIIKFTEDKNLVDKQIALNILENLKNFSVKFIFFY